MNLTFRLMLSFLIVISFAGLTMAHGRTVEVQARIVAINADGQSLVRGQVSMVAGRLTIHAESVQWGDKETSK